MAGTDDPNQDVTRYKNERGRIEADPMADADREALLEWGDHFRGYREISTTVNNLSGCRKAAMKADAVGLPPVVEWDEATFNRFMVRMDDVDFPEYHPDRDECYLLNRKSDDGSWSDGYIRNVRQQLKNLLVYVGHGWAEEIEVGAPPKPSVKREDLLDQTELDTLWRAAEHPRDKCLVALPLTTWQRNAVIRSFRVGDVTFPEGKRTGYVTINESARGRKGANGERPLTWATGPVERWIEVHPRQGDPDFDDAPLLCVITDAGHAEKGTPIKRNEDLNRRLRTVAERAGLDRDRWDTRDGRKERTLSAHTLRYTGATRAAISDEYKELNVKAWGGWNMSSKQLDRYVQVVEQDILAAADAAHGIDVELPQRPRFESCPKCGGAIEEWHRACPTCTMLLTDEIVNAQESVETVREDVTEGAIEEAEHSLAEGYKAARKATDDREAFIELVTESAARAFDDD